jgi:hypothetical protein
MKYQVPLTNTYCTGTYFKGHVILLEMGLECAIVQESEAALLTVVALLLVVLHISNL